MSAPRDSEIILVPQNCFNLLVWVPHPLHKHGQTYSWHSSSACQRGKKIKNGWIILLQSNLKIWTTVWQVLLLFKVKVSKPSRSAEARPFHVGNSWTTKHTHYNDVQSRSQSCNCMVKHHKKSEMTISYLNKCNRFWKSMADFCSSLCKCLFVFSNILPRWYSHFKDVSFICKRQPELRYTAWKPYTSIWQDCHCLDWKITFQTSFESALPWRYTLISEGFGW